MTPKQLLFDSDESESDSDGGVPISRRDSTIDGQAESSFKINDEYAARFTHNKKREELHQLQEKYQNSSANKRNGGAANRAYTSTEGADHDEDTSSSSEEEDDLGELVTEELDDEIAATLKAIRSKDPIVYDKDATFYKPIEVLEGDHKKYEHLRPMFLRDYHRETLLKDANGITSEDTDEKPNTYAQEQDSLHRNVIQEIHAAAEEYGPRQELRMGWMPKAMTISWYRSLKQWRFQMAIPREPRQRNIVLDISEADKDPETFLSNFMASKAWHPTLSTNFQPFESDDEEDDKRADEFETAYNMRFEDPLTSNEKLVSHARDMAAKHSVRREQAPRRKRARDQHLSKIDLEKERRSEEKARLRKLKIEEAEQKLKQIKKAAGLRGTAMDEDQWFDFLEEGWDKNNWEDQMRQKFGEQYYQDVDEPSDDGNEESARKKRKIRKPKWDDDIDIIDIVPDFAEIGIEHIHDLADENQGQDSDYDAAEATDGTARKSKTKREHLQEQQEKKRAARKQRRKVEAFVDEKLDLDLALPTKSSGRFVYRETSPLSYGLTPRDILLASDSQLNQFAGLKKLAAFRDSDKKRRDKKQLSKKARLREWRKETFGTEDVPDFQTSNNTGYESISRPLSAFDNGKILEGQSKKKKSRSREGAKTIGDGASET